jgi:hypothetical protein
MREVRRLGVDVKCDDGCREEEKVGEQKRWNCSKVAWAISPLLRKSRSFILRSDVGGVLD